MSRHLNPNQTRLKYCANMTEPAWIDIGAAEIFAKPIGLWNDTKIFVEGPGLLRIEVIPEEVESQIQPSWFYSLKYKHQCTANGDQRSLIPLKRCLTEKAPVGALIGKVGGSVADRGGDAIFLVGSFCVIEIPSERRGPLFLTINDLVDGYTDNDGSLKISVKMAK
jgi:hypothetical protein